MCVLPMWLGELPKRVDRLDGFDALLAEIDRENGKGQVEGLAGAAKSLLLARVFQNRGKPLLLITYQAEQAARILDDLRQFGIPREELFLMPSAESRWMADSVTDHVAVGERIAALSALAVGEPCVVVGTPEAVFQRASAPEDLIAPRITIRKGESVELEQLLPSLLNIGYESDTSISRPGQFSRRGGILDIYPSTAESPVRLELFGDEIESLRAFDVLTQRSTGELDSVTIGPAREIILTDERVNAAVERIREDLQARKMQLAKEKNREAFDTLTETIDDDLTRLQNSVYFDGLEEYLPFLVPESICALDFLVDGALVVLDEPAQSKAHWERLRAELADSRERRFAKGELLHGSDQRQTCEDGFERISSGFRSLILSQLPRTFEGFRPRQRLAVSSASMGSYRSRLSFFADEVSTWLQNGADCLVISDQPHRVREICAELKIPLTDDGRPTTDGENPQSAIPNPQSESVRRPPSAVHVLEGRVRQGFKFADIGLFVATDAELFGSTRPLVSRRRANRGIAISTVLDLRENDYVVHVHHGIGIYRGLVKRRVDETDRDYLYIQYAAGDALYVPADQIDRIQRYVGGDASPPAVSRIGGNDWQRTTRKVKEQAKEIAKELIELYAARHAAERPSLGPDTPWQTEMEDAFPYDETPSQRRAINDVKADLEETRPMDRLVCGDVGFGKTEVAIRAAFKVAEAGKQVAVLCPTTILAAQHHTTFSERLAAYPIKVELLSRFRSRQEQKKVVEAMKAGEVDVVIGTHRLLSKDVDFNNLGLIIVDEEQRFGVVHKERLKQLRRTVDSLTLTATPIPRTLSMALSGLREMSVIDDPPSGRTPIVTRVGEYDEELVRDAILRELERDGQVYFVHNRIESIDYVAQRIQRLVPDARIRVGHGQMSEDELEQIMYDCYHHEYDVLISTTIIENGLDIPNVNTIIVDRADRMGLAQLYQLRGRVGRSDRQAYAYLLYRPHKALSEDAESRLVAIREFSALGSGFQVAMRDLEIRGAGNLLGAEQSGAMVSVGFDLYCQLLAQAVSEVKGEEVQDDTLPAVDVPTTAHIPGDYIPNEAERIFFYKKMSAIRAMDDIRDVQEELIDRYGDPPRPVWNALAVLRLRLRAKEAGIASIRGERRDISIRLAPHARLSPDAIRLLTFAFKNHRFTPDSVVVPLTSPKVLEEVEEMIDVVERALSHGKEPAVAAR